MGGLTRPDAIGRELQTLRQMKMPWGNLCLKVGGAKERSRSLEKTAVPPEMKQQQIGTVNCPGKFVGVGPEISQPQLRSLLVPAARGRAGRRARQVRRGVCRVRSLRLRRRRRRLRGGGG